MITEENAATAIEENTYKTERGKPMPSLDHSLIQLRLGFLLMRAYEGKYTFASELTQKISQPGATPDLCIYPKMQRNIGQQPDVVKMEEPPITTIEILSPTQALADLTDKVRDLYFPNGVRSAWVVLPELRAVAVFNNGKEGYDWFNEGRLNDEATGIQLDVEEIFNV